MKKLLVSLLAVAALSACGEQEAPATQTPEPQAREAAPQQPAGPRGRKIPQALPEGVVLGFPHHFRGQQVAVTDSGRTERRMTVEFLSGDVDATAQALRESMISAGFRASGERRFDDGRVRLVFGKKGFGRVTAMVAPIGGRKLRNPDARGTVYMIWPEPSA
ncbi:hypothetical protein [Arenimonas aestuarii]